MDLDIRVFSGSIKVESISGHVGGDSFVLHIHTREKYVEVLCVGDQPTTLYLRADERTLRRGKPANDGPDAKLTQIEIPGDWLTEAARGRYSCRIIGVRRPDPEAFTHLPFTVVALS